MEYIVIITVALFVAALTFFSGFGLGTLLLPAFALFFPVQVAVAATAIVHLLNNIYKVILIGRYANIKIVLLFSVPAIFSAVIGAYLLSYFSELKPLAEYFIGSKKQAITPVNLVIGLLMILFALFELIPVFKKTTFKNKYIPLGGLLSGFFGGISGHQGALRTAFLIHAGLEKKSFIGTMVISAILIDISRLFVYGLTFLKLDNEFFNNADFNYLLLTGTIAAFIGSSLGRYLIEKITFDFIHTTVGIMLMLLGLALCAGLI